MSLSRYCAHVIVLLIAVSLAGYASINRHFPSGASLRLGAVNAEGLVLGEGGEVGSLNLSRGSTIVKPLAPPTTSISHEPINYEVAGSDDLKSIAVKFNLSPEQVRWSNPLLMASDKVTPGQKLLLPPVPGVVVIAHQGDTTSGLSAAYHADAAAIRDFNYLRDPEYIGEGVVLVIPGGRGSEFSQPPPAASPARTADTPQPARRAAAAPAADSRSVAVGGAPGSFSNGRFPYGYCTWYVATRRNVTWLGNAWEWGANAAAQGYPEGMTPRVGAIMVTRESGWGHVAYVEAVYPDGSWRVSEMNYVGWGVVSQRTIHPGGVSLITFIY